MRNNYDANKKNLSPKNRLNRKKMHKHPSCFHALLLLIKDYMLIYLNMQINIKFV